MSLQNSLRGAVALLASAAAAALPLAGSTLAAAAPRPHNVIIFVADGLRSGIVTPETAPALAAVRARGVDFRNSHSIYPTITTPNASTIATGHLLGDTGNFANSLYIPAPAASAKSYVPPLENNAALGDLNQAFNGDYLTEESVLEAANRAGYSTAAIGKLGPVAIQAVTARDGRGPIIIDDGTGHGTAGLPLAPDVAAAIEAAGLPSAAPDRSENGKAGSATTPGTLQANVQQQHWFVEVAARVLLPRFKAANRPFVMVYWSRDPDGTQHNQGDSLGKLMPGINGPTSMAAIRNASDNLARLRAALTELGLAETTDILVTADHGFSTVAKASETSPAARQAYADVPKGQLPPGFLAIDLAQALSLDLFEPTAAPEKVDWRGGRHPRFGAGLLGADPTHPDVAVAANGGSDLIYLPQANAAQLAPKVVAALLAQDYVGAVFVNDRLGLIPGTLPMSAVGLIGTAATPQPAIMVSFRSFGTGCAQPELCAAEVADTNLQQGQGIHGTLSRADSHNFMAAIGPDFRRGFVDPAPTSNADIGRTAAALLKLDIRPHGRLRGRVLSEAMTGGKPPATRSVTRRSAPSAAGLVLTLRTQTAGGETYFDVAGFPGRAVGLPAR